MTVKEIKKILDDTINVIIYYNYDSKPLMATTLKDVDTWDNIEIETVGMSRTKREVSLVIRLKQSGEMVYPIMFSDRQIYYLDSRMDWIDYMDITIQPIGLKNATSLISEEKHNYPKYNFIFVKAKVGEDKIDLKLRIEDEVNRARKSKQSEVK